MQSSLYHLLAWICGECCTRWAEPILFDQRLKCWKSIWSWHLSKVSHMDRRHGNLSCYLTWLGLMSSNILGDQVRNPMAVIFIVIFTIFVVWLQTTNKFTIIISCVHFLPTRFCGSPPPLCTNINKHHTAMPLPTSPSPSMLPMLPLPLPSPQHILNHSIYILYHSHHNITQLLKWSFRS